MHVIWSRNGHCINVFLLFFEHDSVILVVRGLCMVFSSFFSAGVVYIAKGDDVYLAASVHSAQVTVSHASNSNGSDAQSIARSHESWPTQYMARD